MTEIIDYDAAIVIASSEYKEALYSLMEYITPLYPIKDDLVIRSAYRYQLLIHQDDFHYLTENVIDHCELYIAGWEACKER